MEKTFKHNELETKWYQTWEKKGYFSPSGEGTPYSIMIPPPNVTGRLHMGHGFQEAIMDVLIRYHRMKGNNTLWQVGTDHAGIATQMVVESQLEAKGIKRLDLGREKFIEKVWEWKEQSGGTITQQLRRMGSSIDWSRERFTMDEGLSNAVREVFVQLYNEKLIYRGTRLVNWDPVLNTAVSDLEVNSEEENGFLWHFHYPLSDEPGHLTVATTRPETMLGDTAVAVNPNDERYQHLIGKTINLPLTDRKIPIIADDYVDMEFGTGCVKITPAHDFNDYEMGQRHSLEMINILTKEATLNDNVPKPYRGLDRFVARKKIVTDLDNLGLLEKIDNHKLKVPRGDRSGAVIEPYLTAQWYVDAKTLAKPAIAAVQNGDIEFIPKQYENIYFSWMNDIQDWCISRQLWWGHRIPAWYDDNDNVYVGHSEQEVREKYKLENCNLRQDDDVLDTWFSSGLWTFSTLGWPEKTKELELFHPTSVLVTGFDIIFFWVARMIMLTLHFKKEIPFKHVYVHGLVRDSEGQKMSKSKGNVLDPIDLIDGIDLESLVTKRTSGMMQPKLAKKIEKNTRKEFADGIAAYGTDALRFTYYSLASTGRDIKFDMGRVAGYRNFCNKIWNATRYVLMNTEDHDCGQNINPNDLELSLADRWITSRLQHTTQDIAKAIEDYRFDRASQAIYEFIWNEYCDWYLELSKPVLNDENASQTLKVGARYTLITVLEATLRLLHPFMPFITEEIWQRVAPLANKQGDSIMLAAYPEVNIDLIDQQAQNDIEWVKGIIIGVRNIRGEMNIPPKTTVPLLIKNGSDKDRDRLQTNRQFLITLAKLESIQWLEDTDTVPMSATALVNDIEIFVPMKGLINKEDELSRLNKEIEKLQKEINRLEGKLNNPRFVDKAPADVVQKEKEKEAIAKQSLEKFTKQLASINAL